MQALLQSNSLKLLSILLILCSCCVTIMCIEELTCLFLVWMVTSSAGSGRWQSQEKIMSGLVAEAILLPWALEIYKDNRKWFGHTEMPGLASYHHPNVGLLFLSSFHNFDYHCSYGHDNNNPVSHHPSSWFTIVLLNGASNVLKQTIVAVTNLYEQLTPRMSMSNSLILPKNV